MFHILCYGHLCNRYNTLAISLFQFFFSLSYSSLMKTNKIHVSCSRKSGLWRSFLWSRVFRRNLIQLQFVFLLFFLFVPIEVVSRKWDFYVVEKFLVQFVSSINGSTRQSERVWICLVRLEQMLQLKKNVEMWKKLCREKKK